MLKISILDTQSRRRLVVEGKLVAPWAAELTSVWRKAMADPDGRDVVIYVKCLLELMKEGARFHSSGVFTKQVLKRLARKMRGNAEEEK